MPQPTTPRPTGRTSADRLDLASRLDPAIRITLDELAASRSAVLTLNRSAESLAEAVAEGCTTWWPDPARADAAARCRLDRHHRSPHVDTVSGEVALGHEPGLGHVDPSLVITRTANFTVLPRWDDAGVLFTLKQHRVLATCFDPGHFTVAGRALRTDVSYVYGDPGWCSTPAESYYADVFAYVLSRFHADHDHRTCGLCPRDVW